MFKVLAIVALCVSASFGGIVDPTYRCGGVGTPVQLRISDCEGKCSFTPGKLYNIEEDFFPSSAAPSLTLLIGVTTTGMYFDIVETVLPNSSVQPGNMYTVRHSIVPNDILSGLTVEFTAQIYHTDTRLVEICLAADIDIL